MTAQARPLYFRLLGVRHLRAGPVAAFVLFEGSIAVAGLLALADIVTWWGSIAIPVTVAIMVKIHDRVARALVQPFAVVQMSATRSLRDLPKVGRSAVPGPARLTTEIVLDDAVASPDARPDPDGTAVGRARVTSVGRAAVPEGPPRPSPAPGRAETDRTDGTQATEQWRMEPERFAPGPREPSPTEQDGPVQMRGESARMDRLDSESRARGNQGHFGL